MPIHEKDITIRNFLELFKKIVKQKEEAGICAIQNNPRDLFKRAQSYGTRYKNNSWGWNSNIWARSAAGSVVVEKEEDLTQEHRQLLLRVLEHILCRPMIQIDTNLGQPGSKAEMHCRLYCDSQFPDIAYRWTQLSFPGSPRSEPDATLFFVPHYLENPKIPNSDEMLKVIRFPSHGFTVVTVSSYQGECKKGFLSHWIYHVYKKGGTGEHASLKEFSVKQKGGREKRIVMCVWGLTGSGKSTHGFYIVDKKIAKIFEKNFGVNPLEFISEQVVKNDDIVGVFPDLVTSPERGSWTKTEDVDENQIAIYKAASSSHALHENTEWDNKGDVSFKGELFQYHGKLNQNARTVLRLSDTGYFDGSVDSSAPLNMAVFISPGYLTDYAWLKIEDPAFAAKVLADGRTTGHPAQGRKGVGEERYVSRYCLPFTMGVGNAEHIKRFYGFLEDRKETDNPIEVYQLNTTGRIGTEYEWLEVERNGEKQEIAKTKFQEVNGKRKPMGGTGPTIEETELFLFQASRGAVEYEPHPIWGKKVLVPIKVEGISEKRLKELNPFSYRSRDEMVKLLKAQIKTSKFYLDRQCRGLPQEIYTAMDF
jgi:phosphoenolpyruvate carboxykinase (ATP)